MEESDTEWTPESNDNERPESFILPELLMEVSIGNVKSQPENNAGMELLNNLATLECPVCRKIFPKRIGLRRHFKRSHVKGPQPKESIACSLCDKVLTSKVGFRFHMRNNHSAEGFKCDQCEEVFQKLTEHEAHLRTVHGNGLPCEICGKVLSSKVALVNHHRYIHTGEKPFV